MLKYMITDPQYDLNAIKKAVIKHRPNFVCYRNKLYYNEEEIKEFARFAKRYAKIAINIDSVKNDEIYELFDAIHLSSSHLDKIDFFKNKTVIASTHNINEVIYAKNADFITFSPIFDSKGRKGLGIEIIEEIYSFHKKIIALGGIISQREIEKIKKTKAVGFASIRYFFT